MKNIEKICGIVFSFCLIISCGKEEKVVAPPVNVDNYVTDAWLKFEQSPPDYTQAIAIFTEALSLSPGNVEALTGRGWCYAMLAKGADDIQYTQALNNFEPAVEKNAGYTDAWAGLALVQYAKNNYDQALSYANNLIQLEPAYVFSHKQDITVNDIHLMRAHIYFYKGEYDRVVLILDMLQPSEAHSAEQPEKLLKQMQSLWGIV